MLKLTLAIIMAIMIPFGGAMAQRAGLGLGAIVGEPTGLNGMVWTGRTTAIDFAAAWSSVEEPSFEMHA